MINNTMMIVFSALGLLAVAAMLLNLRKPSNDRLWKEDQARLAKVKIEGDIAHIENVRNIRYGAPGTPYQAVWEKRSYDLSKLKRLWFIVEPFHPTIKAIAHTFISFEFEDDFLSLSVEARKEQGEEYSIVKGMLGSCTALATSATTFCGAVSTLSMSFIFIRLSRRRTKFARFWSTSLAS
jgi:nitrate reductase gamma subunit